MARPQDEETGLLAAGWYDDGSGTMRWWDGQAWTEHVQAPAAVAPSVDLEKTTVSDPSLVAGRYRLSGELGRGSFGVVYLAADTSSGAQVAVKMFTQATPEARASVRAEANALLAVQSQNCLRVIEVVDNAWTLALVTDFVPGVSLRTLLDRHDRLDGPQAAQVLHGAAQGLAAVHAAGLVHGDVKPANIVVTPEGVSTLIDFGLVGLPGVTNEDHSLSGSPAYGAPEQMIAGTRDARSDIYALGVTLFEVLCGQRPFQASTASEMAMAHASAPIPDPRQFAPELSPTLARLVLDCLAKNPTDRPATVVDFLARLQVGADETYGPGWLTVGGLAALAAGLVAGGISSGVVGGSSVAAVGAAPEMTAVGTGAAHAAKDASTAAKVGKAATAGGKGLAIKVGAAAVVVACAGAGTFVGVNHFTDSSKKTSPTAHSAVTATAPTGPAIQAVALTDATYRGDSATNATGSLVLNDGSVMPLQLPKVTVSLDGDGVVSVLQFRGYRYSPDGRWLVVNTSDKGLDNGRNNQWLTVVSTQNPSDQQTIHCSCSGIAFDKQGALLTFNLSDMAIDTYDLASGTPTQSAAKVLLGGSRQGGRKFLQKYFNESNTANPSYPFTWSKYEEALSPTLVGLADDQALIYFNFCSDPFFSPGFTAVSLDTGVARGLKQTGEYSDYPPGLCLPSLGAGSADGATALYRAATNGGWDYVEAIDVSGSLTDQSDLIHELHVFDTHSVEESQRERFETPAGGVGPILQGSVVWIGTSENWYTYSLSALPAGGKSLGEDPASTPWTLSSTDLTYQTHDHKTLSQTVDGTVTLDGKEVADGVGIVLVAPMIQATTPSLSPAPSASATSTPATTAAKPRSGNWRLPRGAKVVKVRYNKAGWAVVVYTKAGTKQKALWRVHRVNGTWKRADNLCLHPQKVKVPKAWLKACRKV